jgi:hypothetical protein
MAIYWHFVRATTQQAVLTGASERQNKNITYFYFLRTQSLQDFLTGASEERNKKTAHKL